jgi:cytosine/creatinine deaminase
LDLVIKNARLRGFEGRRDIGVLDGRISAISNHIAGTGATDIDANGKLVTPGFANIHLHLDKCLTGAWASVWEGATSGSPQAIPSATKVKEKFTESDIIERATRALSTSIIAGTTAVRAFADVDTVGGLLAVKSLLGVREKFRNLLDLQIVAFPQEGIIRDEGAEELLEKSVELGADVVGAMPWYEGSREEAEKHTDIVFRIAKQYGKNIHALIDDNSDPGSRNIEYLLGRTMKEGYRGRVAASHCRGGLDSPDEDYARRIVELAREVDATVVENPHVSLFMYGRTDQHPIRRGVTRVKEFLEAGVNIAAGQDDIDDPYYPFGRGDMLEVAFVMCHAAHLGSPAEMESAFDMVTSNPARGMGLEGYGIREGSSADLVLLDATSVHEALRLQPDRLAVLKRGRLVAETKAKRELSF